MTKSNWQINWRCEVCRKVRQETEINLYKEDISQHFQLPPGTAVRSIIHCNDDPGCARMAPDVVAMELDKWRNLGMGKTIAIDFDGVIAHNHCWVSPTHIENPVEGAKEFCQTLRNLGLWLVVHSCRTNPKLNGPTMARQAAEAMDAWLKKHGIPFDEIWVDVGKPIASAYVDDRGVSCRPVALGAAAFEDALQLIKFLAGITDDTDTVTPT